MMDVFIPTSIRKDQINGIAAHNGQVASKTLVLPNGRTYQAGAVMFRYFRGTANLKVKPLMFDGNLVFTDEVVEGAKSCDLNILFTSDKPATGAAKKKEA